MSAIAATTADSHPVANTLFAGGLLASTAVMFWPSDLVGAAANKLNGYRQGVQQYASNTAAWAGDKVRSALSIETHNLTERLLTGVDNLQIVKTVIRLIETIRMWIASLLYVAKDNHKVQWGPLLSIGLLGAPIILILRESNQ